VLSSRHSPAPLSRTAVSLAISLLGIAPFAQAQTPPGAGVLQQESERALQAPGPATSATRPAAAKPLPESAKTTRVAVKQITIEGATLIPLSELAPLVADLNGQSLTLAELENAAQRIADHYRVRGWFVRVYLPEQDVTDGNIRIQVLEGRFGGSSLDATPTRANAARIQQLVTHRLIEGEPLSAADLERGLLLANDLPGIHASGRLEAGATAGTTRLALHVEDTPFITGDIGLNNYGIKSTGRAQAVGGFALNNPGGSGDRLALRALVAEDIHNGQLHYSLPLGNDGWRLAAHLSTLAYQLGDRYRALDAKGKAHTGGVTLDWAWLRQRDRNLKLSANWEQRHYADDMLGSALRRHRINALTLSISGDRSDTLGGGGITWGELSLTHGRLDIRRLAADQAADAAGPRSEGQYTKLNFQASRLQALGHSGWQVQTAVSGQVADSNLGSSEQFSLGGPHGVRAWPINEARGDAGALLRLELQRPFATGWKAALFYDTGRIRQHRTPWAGWDGGTGQANSYRLSGAGLGLSYDSPAGNGVWSGWRFSTSIATPLGGNPGKGADGRNNDGSSPASTRFWLNLSKTL